MRTAVPFTIILLLALALAATALWSVFNGTFNPSPLIIVGAFIILILSLYAIFIRRR